MSNQLQPPVAPKRDHSLTIHGHTRIDPYYWLRERENREVIDYISAENKYTEEVMAHTEELQETLYKEMVSRIKETDQSVPIKRGNFFYYTRTETGKQYTIHCRKKGSLDAEEEILLDPNALSAGVDYLEVGIFRISPDHNLLAYALDTTGGERYTLFFKDLTTGKLLKREIEEVGYEFEWANDSQTFYYAKLDDAWRQYQIWSASLAEPKREPSLIFEEPDALFSTSLSKSRDSQFVFLNVDSIESSEVHVLDADRPENGFKPIALRQKKVEFDIYHRYGTFFILTNKDGATNFKLMTTPADQPEPENWRPFIPHRDDVLLEDIDLFADYLVLYERSNGLRQLRIAHFAGRDQLGFDQDQYLQFEEAVYTFEAAQNYTFDTNYLIIEYTSMRTPLQTVALNMGTYSREVLKEDPVLGGYDKADYVTKRLFATAADGTQIPISIYHRHDIEISADTPCLLYGYGSYGVVIEPEFRSEWVSFVNRGMICAIAHIRGGEAMGREWYQSGKFLNKRNTFTDFIACGRHLIDIGFTSSSRLAIMGRSAGGLLIGAVLNLAPDLCQVAVAGVPFVDVITTMLDESIPLTVGEYEEWGNPNDPAFYDYMLTYSPYDNLAASSYPHILATSGISDPRVQYWEPTKWVAKLRTLVQNDNRLILKTNMSAGHSGASGRYTYIKELAFDYAFILDGLGL